VQWQGLVVTKKDDMDDECLLDGMGMDVGTRQE